MKIDLDLESAERVIIDLEKSADFYVNSDLNDFKEFFIRPLIIE